MDWQDRGLILASHVLHEVEAVTDSFLLICNGRLLASGSVAEVKSLLADVPNEIWLRCEGATELACRLVQEPGVDAVRFAENGKVLVLSTHSPAAIYAQLPQWIDGTGIRIHELRSRMTRCKTCSRPSCRSIGGKRDEARRDRDRLSF